jgi:phenylpyruvate tautomerase
MPYVSIQTNQSIPPEKQNALLAAVSDLVSSQLGKSEEYVMAATIRGSSMIFARDHSPAAFVELSSIGVPDEKRNSLCSGLTELISAHTAIPSNRIHVVLADISPRLWGYQGKPFR